MTLGKSLDPIASPYHSSALEPIHSIDSKMEGKGLKKRIGGIDGRVNGKGGESLAILACGGSQFHLLALLECLLLSMVLCLPSLFIPKDDIRLVSNGLG